MVDIGEVLSLLWNFVLLNVKIILVMCVDLYETVFPPPHKSLRDCVVLVTGAGGGLGRELAVQLVGCGTRLVLCDVNQKELQATGEAVQAAGGRVAHLYKCDLTNPDGVNAMAAKVREEVGQPGVVVHCAGVYHHKTLLRHTVQEVRTTLDVNVLSTIWVTRAFLGPMVSSNSGHLVFLSSVLGVMGRPQLAPYCASKFAVTGFADSLSQELEELGASGVNVTIVHPFLIGNITDVSVNIRVPGVFDILSPSEAASEIISAVRRNQEELFLPRKLKPLIRINRCLPRKMRRVCQQFVERK